MVKKILIDGSPCPKCLQAEDILRKRGLWDRIDRVAFAEEGNPDSEGMKLAAEHNVELAPFFIAEDEKGERIYTRVFQFIKKELEDNAGASAESQGASLKDLPAAAEKYSNLEPQEILSEAQELYGDKLHLAFSGAEDVVLIDMAVKNTHPFTVFCLDTGRLHPETYQFIDTVRDRYGISVDIFFPDPKILEPLVREKGMNSFYADGHGECCGIRKVEPLNRALLGASAWATGLRRDQSPATRGAMPVVEWDEDHRNDAGGPLVKFNPLMNWTSDKVWSYIRDHDVPYNPLHDAGFRSIGCSPCTRASRPGEHERMARWWWEDATRRECGLHIKK